MFTVWNVTLQRIMTLPFLVGTLENATISFLTLALESDAFIFSTCFLMTSVGELINFLMHE